MDKKKQIEEMLKLMCEEYGNMCGECESGITCANELHAKRLYKAGYRKIPEGAVVLTREEYEEREKKIREQAQIESVEIYTNALIAERAKARKETAREILQWLKEHCDFVGFGIVETYFRE